MGEGDEKEAVVVVMLTTSFSHAVIGSVKVMGDERFSMRSSSPPLVADKVNTVELLLMAGSFVIVLVTSSIVEVATAALEEGEEEVVAVAVLAVVGAEVQGW